MSGAATPDGDVELARIVFADPAGDPDLHPLFLDADSWSSLDGGDDETAELARARGNPLAGAQQTLRTTSDTARGYVTGRRTLRLPVGGRVSLASYFNAFPASYWRRWTSLDSVVLRVKTRGIGKLVVYRSNARAVIQTVTTVELTGESTQRIVLPFANFLDGGWYWFDLIATDEDLELVEGAWVTPSAGVSLDSASIAVTTLNKRDYCLDVVRALSDETLVGLVDEIIVTDQGTERLRDHPDFAEVDAGSRGTLRVLEQPNLGGSGGFARGMLETVRAGRSQHVILLDDDVVVEPESVARAIVFASLTVRPTIVGGHMFDMYDRTKLHAYAESINPDTFFWGPISPTRHDLAASNLRQTPWLHQRMDAGFTGWWMCLISVEVIRTIGLPLPVFIKWDDAEFGIRAREAGFPVVSMPGVGIWHVSWVDKDDSQDWQAFYHARNRLVAALLHSDRPHGGLLARSNLAQDLRFLLTMNYFVVEARLEAYRSVLAGPGRLHAELPSRLGAVRALAARHVETEKITDLSGLPAFAPRAVPGVRGGGVDAGPTGAGLVAWLARQIRRHATTRPAADSAANPSAHLAFAEARWWVVPDFDSVLVSNADGSSAALHVRDPRRFRRLLRESIRLNLAYRGAWERLAREYRAGLQSLVSEDAWARTLDLPAAGTTRQETVTRG